MFQSPTTNWLVGFPTHQPAQKHVGVLLGSDARNRSDGSSPTQIWPGPQEMTTKSRWNFMTTIWLAYSFLQIRSDDCASVTYNDIIYIYINIYIYSVYQRWVFGYSRQDTQIPVSNLKILALVINRKFGWFYILNLRQWHPHKPSKSVVPSKVNTCWHSNASSLRDGW